MSKKTDDRLEALLDGYYKAEPEKSFVFDPKKASGANKVRYFNIRAAAAAASIVLACAIGVTVFVYFGSSPDDSIPVSPNSVSSTLPSWQNNGSGSDVLAPNSKAETKASETGAVNEPSEKTDNTAPASNGSITDTASSAAVSESATSPHAQSETVRRVNPETDNTEKPASQPTQPTQSVTQSAQTENVTYPPTQPTQAETQKQTQAPTQRPTMPPKPIWPSEQHYSGDPSSGNPQAGFDQLSVNGCFATELLSEGYRIYCRLYTADGVPLGDEDPYADSHRAAISYISSPVVYVEYAPDRLDFETDTRQCRYEFYNLNGTVLCSGIVPITL